MRLIILLTIGMSSIFCLLGTSLPASGQEDQEVAERKKRVEKFLNGLSDDEQMPKKHFEDILDDGPLKSRSEAINRLVDRFEEIQKASGKYSMSEAISEKRVGTDLILLKYLSKAENYPVVWYFTFYRRPSDKIWIVISLRFDTRLEQLER